jgi:hypothetical protein
VLNRYALLRMHPLLRPLHILDGGSPMAVLEKVEPPGRRRLQVTGFSRTKP